jgi:hypothetical protein
MDVYEDALAQYRKDLAAWEAQSSTERGGEEVSND